MIEMKKGSMTRGSNRCTPGVGKFAWEPIAT
jgi:hypothetical protein